MAVHNRKCPCCREDVFECRCPTVYCRETAKCLIHCDCERCREARQAGGSLYQLSV